MLRAAPKKRLGLCSALASTPLKVLAGSRLYGIVGTCQAGDGVEQDYHVVTAFNQTACLVEHDLGNLHVTVGRLIESEAITSASRSAPCRSPLGTLVDEQYDHNTSGDCRQWRWRYP